MKPHMSQVLLIALALLFTMALAITVSLISLSFSTENATRGPDLPVDLPLSDTSSSTALTESTSTPPVELPPVNLGNGLSFASNGDGTCTLTGIGSCRDACIIIPEVAPSGDIVTAVAPRALYGCSFITALQIPASVQSIGALAFSNCQSLAAVTVSSSNEAFCDIDGILYTSDGRALLLYPPMRAGSEITISSVTEEIAEMAFYNCPFLSRVHYTGSAERWERISIAPKNYSLTAAAKVFYG